MTKTRLIADSANDGSIDGARLEDQSVSFDKLIREYVHVEDYGAVPDIVDRQDGIITSGSWEFQTPTNCFSSDDIGKIMVLCGMYSDPVNTPNYGPNWYSVADNTILCTIQTYNSPTSVTLQPIQLSGTFAPPPDRSLSGVSFYFGTNNRDAFRNAIDEAHQRFLNTGRPQGIYCPGCYGVGGPGNTTQLVWLKSGVTVFGDTPNSSKLYGLNVYGGPFGIGNGVGQNRLAASSDGGSTPPGGFRPWKTISTSVNYGDSSIVMGSPADAAYIGTGIKLLRSQAFANGFPYASQLVKVVRVAGSTLYLERPLRRDFGPSYIDKEQPASVGPVAEAGDFFVEKCGLDSIHIKNLRNRTTLATNGAYSCRINNCEFTGALGFSTNSFNVEMTNCVFNVVFPSTEVKVGTFDCVIDGLVFNQVEPPLGQNLSHAITATSTPNYFTIPFLDIGENVSGISISNVTANFPKAVSTEFHSDVLCRSICAVLGAYDVRVNNFKGFFKALYGAGISTAEVAEQDFSKFSQEFSNFCLQIEEVDTGNTDGGLINIQTGFALPYPRKNLRFSNINLNNDAICPILVKWNSTNAAVGCLIDGVRGPGAITARYVGTQYNSEDYGIVTNSLFTKFEVSDLPTGIKNQRLTFVNNNRYDLATFFNLSYVVQDWARSGVLSLFPESSDYTTNAAALWRTITIPSYSYLMPFYDGIDWEISGKITAGSISGADCRVVVEYDFGGGVTRVQNFLVGQDTGDSFVLRNHFYSKESAFVARGDLSASSGSDAIISDVSPFDWSASDFTIRVYTYKVAPSNTSTTIGTMYDSQMKIDFFGV